MEVLRNVPITRPDAMLSLKLKKVKRSHIGFFHS